MVRIVLAYAAMCLIWGTTWLGIKISLATLPPFTGVGLRFIIAGILLGVVAMLRGELRPFRAYPWKVIVALALLLFGGNYVLNYIAETRLDSGLVSVLFGTLPFFTFGFGALLIRERPPVAAIGGAIAAFIGVAVISLSGPVTGSAPFVLCAIGAAASAALGNVYAKAHAHHPPLVTLPPAMLLSGLVVGTLGLIVEHTNWSAVASVPSLGSLLYLAVFGSCIAFFLMMWLLKRISASTVGLASLVFPIVALLVGALFGGERLTTREIIGSAAVIGGLAVALGGRAPASAEMRSDRA